MDMKQIYNITDYGAVAGSSEVQTAKIQAAIDAAFAAGGGEVVVPKGVFKTGTIRLRSNITFRMLSGAVIDGIWMIILIFLTIKLSRLTLMQSLMRTMIQTV